MKPDFRTKADYQAECEGCGWTCYSANAMGLAAQHAERCGGYTRVEKTVVYIWNRAGAPYQNREAS